MTELFKGYEQEFIQSLGTTNKKIQSISVQSNRTTSLTQIKNKWPSLISRKI